MATGKMIIKLKIPKDIHFECPTCTKSFSSGKALGGHKRVHMEKRNKRNHESMELQSEENGEKTLFPCPVCPQSFASEKSLHGHMRKHPDRGWRGMRPPPPPLLPQPPMEAAVVEAPPSKSPPLDQEAISVANNFLALKGSESVIGLNSSLVNDDEGKTNDVEEQKEYVCDICGNSYRTTYHTLGGHKSHHGPEDDKSGPVCMEQSEGCDEAAGHEQMLVDEGAQGNGDQSKEVFGIDLNDLPPERAGFGGDPNW